MAAITLAIAIAGAQDATGLTYRIAGTIAIDEQHAVALIESSTGAQQLYSLGDHIDGWEIVGIDPQEVTFGRAGQIVRLPLMGTLAPLTVRERADLNEFSVTTGSASLDFGRAFEELRQLESKPVRNDSGLTYADINSALGLTAATRIREIDGEPAASPMAVVQLSMVALASNNPFRLTVSDNNSDEIYLLPSE